LAYFEEIFAEYPYLLTAMWVILTAVVSIVLERLVTRWVRRFTKQRDLSPDVENSLILTSRIVILVGAAVALLRVGGVSSDILVAFSAIGGAAIGFASTRTVGNFIAGIYLLITRPFRVGDYVRIDGIEGIVNEITMNYAKILTPTNTMVSISTQRILDKEIVNYRYGESRSKLFCYGFEISFDHYLTTEKLEGVLNSVIERYAEKLPRKPEYQTTKLTRLERGYMVYIYVEEPRDIFMLQPRMLREIIQTWDKARTKNQ
jgi:small conductance mechanosensitive channel